MKTVVAAPLDLWEEINTTLQNTTCIRVSDPGQFERHQDARACFNLFDGGEKLSYHNDDALIFLNCVSYTLSDNTQPANVFRINGWNGFLKNSIWEISGKINDKVSDYVRSVGKKMLILPDAPGFVSCRILSMIINEAYFTLQEGVSEKEEIDIAMKLGTNYPRGPFEWSKEIGIKKVHELLDVLSKEDSRYSPSPMLVKECMSI